MDTDTGEAVGNISASAQYLPRYIYISGHGPWTSSRITRYIYQTATGDEGNWPAWTRPDPPFLLFRNIVIFIKFFHGSGVTHIANVCSPGTDAINQVTNIGGGRSRANERDYWIPLQRWNFRWSSVEIRTRFRYWYYLEILKKIFRDKRATKL